MSHLENHALEPHLDLLSGQHCSQDPRAVCALELQQTPALALVDLSFFNMTPSKKQLCNVPTGCSNHRIRAATKNK